VQAVRLVRQLRAELASEHGTVTSVARQLGYKVESVRALVDEADIDDGLKGGTTSADAERTKTLEQENREVKRANESLHTTSAYVAEAELDRPLR
jgi:transposase